jgi:hypothetical protein
MSLESRDSKTRLKDNDANGATSFPFSTIMDKRGKSHLSRTDSYYVIYCNTYDRILITINA